MTATTAGARTPARTDDRRAQRRLAYLLIAPAVILMLAVTAYPILYAFWLSLQRYNLASPADTRFVWFENYSTILTDKYWWTAFVITAAITVISVAIEFVLGMALALVMHRTIFGHLQGQLGTDHRHSTMGLAEPDVPIAIDITDLFVKR